MHGEPVTERRDAGVTRGFGYLAVWAAILGFGIPTGIMSGMYVWFDMAKGPLGSTWLLYCVGLTLSAYLLGLLVFVVWNRAQFQMPGRSFAWGCMVGAWVVVGYPVFLLVTPDGIRSFDHDTLALGVLTMLASALGHGLVMLAVCGLIRALGSRRACT